MDLNTLKVIVEVVNCGSFSAASKKLNMPVSTVSRRVSELEESIGFRLIERSTRNLRVTEAGKTLHQYAQRCVEEMESGILALAERQDQVEGTLKVAMPPNLEAAWLGIKQFMNLYPKVKVQILGISREVDPISDYIDIVIQYHASKNPSVISRRVATMTPILVASKNYVEKNGQPNTVHELNDFNCIARENPDVEPFWNLDNEAFYFQPSMTTNEFSLLRYLIKHDLGIGQLPPYFCKKEIENGEFVTILPDVAAPKIDIHLVYPSRKYLSRVARAFIDHSVGFINEESSWLWTPR